MKISRYLGGLVIVVPVLALGQVKTGSVQIGNSTIEQQLLTISCPELNMKTGKEDGGQYLITMHLANQTYNVPVQTHGFFDWRDKKWYTFEKIDSNFILFFSDEEYGDQEKDRVVEHTLRTPYGNLPGGSETKTSSVGSCYRWTKKLDRNTLNMYWIGESTLHHDTSRTSYYCNGAPERDMELHQRCQLVEYREPPMRLGF